MTGAREAHNLCQVCQVDTRALCLPGGEMGRDTSGEAGPLPPLYNAASQGVLDGYHISACTLNYTGTSLIRNNPPAGFYDALCLGSYEDPGVWVFLMSEVPLYTQPVAGSKGSGLSVHSRCCTRIGIAMVRVPHRPLLPSPPTRADPPTLWGS